jgi:hypothetical protein
LSLGRDASSRPALLDGAPGAGRRRACDRHSATQASVNPKAEVVEELKSRRKRLHSGMVKLAREDLERNTLQAETAFKVRSSIERPARPLITAGQ